MSDLLWCELPLVDHCGTAQAAEVDVVLCEAQQAQLILNKLAQDEQLQQQKRDSSIVDSNGADIATYAAAAKLAASMLAPSSLFGTHMLLL